MTAIAQVAPIAGRELAATRSRVAAWIARIGAILRQLGPYAAIELLLPGGTLMALLLWCYRRTAYIRARACTPQSAAHTHLCMQCGVANGHFDLGSGIRLHNRLTGQLAPPRPANTRLVSIQKLSVRRRLVLSESHRAGDEALLLG
jgi:hypothetical protein